jgi:hypothetical protein
VIYRALSSNLLPGCTVPCLLAAGCSLELGRPPHELGEPSCPGEGQQRTSPLTSQPAAQASPMSQGGHGTPDAAGRLAVPPPDLDAYTSQESTHARTTRAIPFPPPLASGTKKRGGKKRRERGSQRAAPRGIKRHQSFAPRHFHSLPALALLVHQSNPFLHHLTKMVGTKK